MTRAALRTGLSVLALASAGFARASMAPPQQPSSDEIVVTGTKATPREIEKAARAVMPSGDLYHEPLAQFQRPVCPGVIGMPDDFAAAVIARIRFVAAQAKIRVALSERCQPNLLVLFVPSGQAAMRNLLKGGPWLFGALDPSAIRDLAADPALRDLAADPGPAHAWVNSETRSRYGESLSGRGDSDEPKVLKTFYAPSRLHMEARQDIVASLVVIDIPAIRDMSPVQIADYAAMRGLVQTRPPGQPGHVATILNLFDKGAAAPFEMTRFDQAYLRAIYGSIPNVAGITKIAEVAREVRRGAKAD